ncbi:gamma-glutamylcyclotransferase family protein, partial [Lentibacter algarum]|uniref:gamma-glutamylcyclotransferase family protein n=1 Tax=Lentibacter algarum TaxID=576131 RepID=UPI003BAF7B84
MKQVFLYGTLRHLGLLEIVLGHVPHDRLSEVSLDGYCVARAEGHDFPLILEQSRSSCDGLLLSEVTPAEQARLDYYELGFGYRLLPVEIAGQEALVYFPEPDLWQAAEPWSLKEWSALHWPVTQHSAREIMGLMGQVAPHELGRYFGRIRARAYSTFLAQSNPSPATLRAAHS